MIHPASPPLGKKVIRLVVATTSLAILVLCAASYAFLRGDLRDLALRKMDALAHIHADHLQLGFDGFADDAAFLSRAAEVPIALSALAEEGDPAIPPSTARYARRSVERLFSGFLAQRAYLTRAQLIGPAAGARVLARTDRAAGTTIAIAAADLAETAAGVLSPQAATLAPQTWQLFEVSGAARGPDPPERPDTPIIRLIYAIPGASDVPSGYIVLDARLDLLLRRGLGTNEPGIEMIATTAGGDWILFSRNLPDPTFNLAGPGGRPLPAWTRQVSRTHGFAVAGQHALGWLQVDTGGGWSIGLTLRMQVSGLLTEANARLLQLGLVSLILLMATGAIGTVLSRRLAAPLSHLADRVSLPRAEFEPISLPIAGYREVEVLATAFEGVVNSLAQEGRNSAAVSDAAADGIIMTDEKGKILRANKAAERMFGAAAGGLPGSSVADLMPEEHRAAHARHLQGLDTRSGGAEMAPDRALMGLRGDGSTFPLEASINKVSDNDRQTLIAVVRDVTERRERDRRLAIQSSELEWRATHDQLSGLLNRRGIEEAMRRIAGTETEATVIQIDLDRFKLVNDTLGHEAGDTVIRAIAERLREIARPQDSIGRMGGDEFVVMRPGGDLSAIDTFAARAMPHLAAQVPYRDRICRFGVSIGAATGPAGFLLSGELFKRADHALYRAKNEGRGQYRLFTSEMERRLRDRASLAADLEVAMETDCLIVEYMPKARASDGRLIGIEALVRWHHPDRGILPPDAFLPLAEDLKLTDTIDHRVLLQVMADRRGWMADGCDVPPISVNVSARRLRDPELVASVRALDIPAGAINFELLESIFLDDASNAMTWSVDALREMGIGIEIDDFGSGHASILGITQIRPDWIKIDKALVRHIEESESSRTLVRAITDMASPFGIETLAEGVETRAQAEILREIGCSALQGYFIGRPRGPDITRDLLRPARVVNG